MVVVVVVTKVVIIVLRLDTWIVSVLVQALALATTVVLGKSWVALIGSFGRSIHNVVVRVRDMCWSIGRTWRGGMCVLVMSLSLLRQSLRLSLGSLGHLLLLLYHEG